MSETTPLRTAPDYPEDSRTFDQNQREFVPEGLPRLGKPPEIAIVMRAYRELSNGNLAQQFLSLSSQEIDKQDFETIIVVNNPRIFSTIANLTRGENLQTINCHDLAAEIIQRRDLNLSAWELNYLRSLTNEKLERNIVDYEENQATLQILNVISTTVEELLLNPFDNTQADQVIELALTKIDQFSTPHLKKPQIAVLRKASEQMIRTKTRILGLDCSSEVDGFRRVSLGQATNEGCHVAYQRGALYFDISDMDDFRPPTALKEIYNITQEVNPPDILLRPLQLVTPQHPEQFDETGKILTKLIYYYRVNYPAERKGFSEYATTVTHRDDNDITTGKIICSRNAFKIHQYPHGDWFEDLIFSERLISDPALTQRYLLDSPLLRSFRGRDVSYDGRGLSRLQRHKDLEAAITFADDITNATVIKYDKLIQQTDSIFASTDSQQIHSLQEEYERIKERFFLDEQDYRKFIRKVFLGIQEGSEISEDGILVKIFKSAKKHLGDLTINTQEIIEAASLTERQQAFLIQNQVLVPCLLQEMKIPENGLITLQDLVIFLENYLPELFEPPLLYKKDSLSQRNNLNNIYQFQSWQWLEAKIKNLLQTEHFSEDELALLVTLQQFIDTI